MASGPRFCISSIHHLFSVSLANGILPSEWNVNSIILCTIFKILERLVFNKITAQITDLRSILSSFVIWLSEVALNLTTASYFH